MQEPGDADMQMTATVIAELQYSKQVPMKLQTRSSSKFVFPRFTIMFAVITATITSSNA
jgi:hypothetical protein